MTFKFCFSELSGDMDNSRPGPSGLKKKRKGAAVSNVVKKNIKKSKTVQSSKRNTTSLDDSQSEDDFDIPHISDGSGSSSDEEDFALNPIDFEEDKYGYTSVVFGREDLRVRDDPPFLGGRRAAIPLTLGKEPIQFFELFLSNDILNTIVTETNRYARDFFNKATTRAWMTRYPTSRLHQWPADGVTIQDIRQYLGLLINMGVNSKTGAVADFWTTRPSQTTPYYSSVMSVNLFLLIHRFLHLNDTGAELEKDNENYDPWVKVRVFLDAVNGASKRYYSPSQHVSIDESMIGMKNRCAYIQYMPNKRHARFGIKKFQLCDDNGFVIHINLYAGKDIELHGEEGDGQAVTVVKNLLHEASLYNRGHRVYTDNFYTKPKLADYLTARNTILVGTVRANSKDIPEAAKTALAVGEARFWRRGDLLFCAFREKKTQTKPVLLLSTGHNATKITLNRRNKPIEKPTLIHDYNLHMGGVDISDKMVCHYASERATRRYWKKIFQNLLDVSLLNAFLLYENTPGTTKMKRKLFIITIVESLCLQHPTPPPLPPPPTALLHQLVLLGGRKEMQCAVCSKRPKGNQIYQTLCRKL